MSMGAAARNVHREIGVGGGGLWPGEVGIDWAASVCGTGFTPKESLEV